MLIIWIFLFTVRDPDKQTKTAISYTQCHIRLSSYTEQRMG